MIKKIFHLFIMVVLSISIFYCAPPRPVHAPPPAKKEIRTRKPGPNYIWVSGHYEWRRGRWVWVSGHWVKKKHGKTWVKGHWVKRGRNWVWVPGHWK